MFKIFRAYVFCPLVYMLVIFLPPSDELLHAVKTILKAQMSAKIIKIKTRILFIVTIP